MKWRSFSTCVLSFAIVSSPGSSSFAFARAQDAGAKSGAERSRYATSLSTATRALARGDLGAAERALDATEMTERGFEWRHVRLCVELGRAPALAPEARRTSGRHFEVERELAAPITVLTGHTDACRVALFSPRGDRIASASSDRSVRMWNARTGDLVWRSTSHDAAVTSLAFAPDGKRLVFGSDDGTARVWDAENGNALLVLRAGQGAVRAVAWSRDGAWIATAPSDKTVRVWPSAHSEARIALSTPTGSVTSLAFCADSKRIVAASEDGSVRVFDFESGDVKLEAKGGAGSLSALACDATDTLRAGSAQGSVLVWTAGDASPTLAHVSSRAVLALAMTTDGDRIAAGDEGGEIQILDGGTLRVVHSLAKLGAPIRCLAFSPRGDRLVACGDDAVIRIFETDADTARAAQRNTIGALPSADEAEKMKPLDVDALCARIVQRPGLDAKLYESAEALARATFERLHDSGAIQTTIGGAEYRLGKYENALATLIEAGDRKRGWPANLAFRALTLAKLERDDEARAMLARLATLLKEERWAHEVEAGALYEEARLTVAARPPPKK